MKAFAQPDAYTDLHMHSTCSDGTLSPAQLVIRAKSLGLHTIAVTDHDTIDGVEEAVTEGTRQSIRVIPGIEISADYPKELHILGYQIDIHSIALVDACYRFQVERDLRTQRILEWLRSFAVRLTLGDVMRYVRGQVVGRLHFARAMVEKGYVSTTREAFDKYLTGDAFDRLERKKPFPEEAIQLILNAGGVAVLAHPISVALEGQRLFSFFRDLKKMGLCGIEAYYPKHSPEFTAQCLAYATELDLFVTRGSDFHSET